MNQNELDHSLFDAIENPDSRAGERVAYYLQQGTDITATNAMGDTPLTAAAHDGHLDALRALLDFAPERHLNLTSAAGLNALMSAMRGMPQNFHDIAGALIDAGIDLGHREPMGKTVADFARKGGWRDRNEVAATWLREKIGMESIGDVAVKKVITRHAQFRPRNPGAQI